MFSDRIAIRLPPSFMVTPLSGFARRLGEERTDQRPQLTAVALRARRFALVVLADRHGNADFFLTLFAEILVERHGLLLAQPAGTQARLTTTDFTSVYSSMPSCPPSRPRPDSLKPPNGI